MKFNHGDRVTCKIQEEKIYDGKISINKDGKYYVCQNVLEGDKTPEKFGYKYSWRFCPDSPDRDGLKDIRILNRTIDSHPLEEGDILLDINDINYRVIGVCGKVVFVSFQQDFESVGYVRTQKQLIDTGWKLYQGTTTEQEIKEVTLDEVAKALGIPVEKLRIKD